MDGEEVFRRLNHRGQVVGRRVVQQQQEVEAVRLQALGTQAGLSSTIERDRGALQVMHSEFHSAAQLLHTQNVHSGASQLAALGQVVLAARTRFEELDGRLGRTVSEVEAK